MGDKRKRTTTSKEALAELTEREMHWKKFGISVFRHDTTVLQASSFTSCVHALIFMSLALHLPLQVRPPFHDTNIQK